MPKNRYLTAKQAADILNISLSTLYAYVSRGLIRSESTGEGRRARRYYAEDVEKLIARKEARSNPEKLAESALHWGTPLLDSSITLIDGSNLYYRGYDVKQLAIEFSVEQVASLIWTGEFDQSAALFDSENPPSAAQYETMLLHVEVDGADLSPVQSLMVFLPLAASDDIQAYDLRPASVAQTGARILRLMTSVVAGAVPENISIAQMLQAGWCRNEPSAAGILNATLILCADHELNASSFTARVVASAQSTPYAVVQAGMAALQGFKHGGYTEQVVAFLDEIGKPEAARSVMTARLRRGERIPAFGHPIYPDGDPRARFLLDYLATRHPEAPALALVDAVIEAGRGLVGEEPTLDLALAAVSRVLNLPDGGALALFALGRSIGWIGHAIEAYTDDRLIRPRARYIGEQPR